MNLRPNLLVLFGWMILCLTPACKTTNSFQRPMYDVKVKEGDTLAGIAMRFGTSWESIARLNKMRDSRDLRVGQTLKVMPGPGGYYAKSDDPSANDQEDVKINRTNNQNENRNENANTTKSTRTRKTSPVAKWIKERLQKPKNAPTDDGEKQEYRQDENNGDDETGLPWPVQGKITSFYGPRGFGFHQGIDVAAPYGTGIRASSGGTVEFAGRQSGYGNIVVISHRNFKTAYAHLSRIFVGKNQQIRQGQKIGLIGKSGNATSTHLHFEYRLANDRTVDPIPFLRQGDLLSSR